MILTTGGAMKRSYLYLLTPKQPRAIDLQKIGHGGLGRDRRPDECNCHHPLFVFTPELNSTCEVRVWGLAQLEAETFEAWVRRLRRACSRQSEHYAHSQAKNGDDLPPARQQECAGNWTDDLQHRSYLWLGVRSNLPKAAPPA
jgi:hypothetical protein